MSKSKTAHDASSSYKNKEYPDLENKSPFEWQQNSIPEKSLEITRLDLGVKLIATIDERGWPHVTMITFNEAKDQKTVIWGQFTEGTSKKNVLNNPNQGFFYMNATMPFYYVLIKAKFSEKIVGGPDCDYFSRKPLLRYMTYANVHTTFYNSVISATSPIPLKVSQIIKGVLLNVLTKRGKSLNYPNDKKPDKLPPVGLEIFNSSLTPKFLAFIEDDGFPIIIPCFQLRAPDKSRFTFNLPGDKWLLKKLRKDMPIAIFGLITGNPTRPEIVNLHVNGIFLGFQKCLGFPIGQIDIVEIYNSMPPLAGQIYPSRETRKKVTKFD
ncbi:MAG: pyridoxamine 5'-phosphate oxidase family protein [Promethearchaeota archaeon]